MEPTPPDSSFDDLLRSFGLREGDDPDEALLRALREAEATAHDASCGMLGRYDVLGEIGRGGQGVVYRARQPGTGRIVALKRVRAGALASSAARERFRREVEAIASLATPGIVSVYAVEDVDDTPVLVMELVDGEPVTEWAATASRADILDVTIQLCDAVHHAHQRGILHCDLKPSNVLVQRTERGVRPRVLDFGLARWLRAEQPAGADAPGSAFFGTPDWAAPEQAGGSAVVDVRTDLHAIGLLLFAMLTGERPRAEQSTRQATLDALRREPPRCAHEVDASIDPALSAILATALAPSPAARYSSVAALADDLRRYRAHEPIEVYRGGVRHRLALAVRRNRVASIAVALLTVGAIAGSTIIVLQRNEARDAQRRAERVTAFVRDTLASAGPSGLGTDFDLDRLLQDAGVRADTELADEADTAASIHVALGDIQAGRWNWEQAEHHYARAIDLGPGDGTVGGEPIDTVTTRWGRALASRRSPNAVPVLTHAVRQRIERLGADAVDVAESRMRLGYAYYIAQDPPEYDRAERELRAALDVYDRADARDHRDRAACLHILGYMYSRQLRRLDARDCYLEALAIMRRRGDETDPHYGDLLYGHVALLGHLGRFEEIVALRDEARRVLERAHNRSRLIATYRTLAMAECEAGEVEVAEQLTREYVESVVARVMRQEPLLTPSLEPIRAAMERDRVRIPVYELQAAIDEASDAPLAVTIEVDRVLVPIAHWLEVSGRVEEARQILDRLLAHDLGPGWNAERVHLGVVERLARLEFAAAQYERAAALTAFAEHAEPYDGPDPTHATGLSIPRRQRLLTIHARARAALGDHDTARRVLDLVLPNLREHYGDRHPDVHAAIRLREHLGPATPAPSGPAPGPDPTPGRTPRRDGQTR